MRAGEGQRSQGKEPERSGRIDRSNKERHPDGRLRRGAGGARPPRKRDCRVRPQRRAGHVRGTRVERPRILASHSTSTRSTCLRSGSQRMPHCRHGVGDQLQYRVDIDLRAPVHLLVPRALRPGKRARSPARSRLSHRWVRRRRRCVADRSRGHPLEGGRRGNRSLQLRRPGGARGSQRFNDRSKPAHLGLREQLWRDERDSDG